MSDEITDTESASARAFDYDRTVAPVVFLISIPIALFVSPAAARVLLAAPAADGADRAAAQHRTS